MHCMSLISCEASGHGDQMEHLVRFIVVAQIIEQKDGNEERIIEVGIKNQNPSFLLDATVDEPDKGIKVN